MKSLQGPVVPATANGHVSVYRCLVSGVWCLVSGVLCLVSGVWWHSVIAVSCFCFVGPSETYEIRKPSQINFEDYCTDLRA